MNVRRRTPIVLLVLAAAACNTDGAAGRPATSVDAGSAGVVPVGTGSAPAAETASAEPRDEPLQIIVDYSPTSSDVAALMYVTQHPDADLLAVTLAGTGESHCTKATSNTEALLASVGLSDVPVACGREQPIGPGNEWPDEWRASADRLDGLDLRDAGDAAASSNIDAADLLASLASDAHPVTIIALGPLTNLAVAIERHDGFAQHVAGVVTMGGAVTVIGNATNDTAEWNYFIDPTAVDIVLRSGIPVTMVPLDATNDVPVTRAWFDALGRHRTTVAANAVHDLFEASRPFEFGFYFWDELATAATFDPTLVTFDEQPISIDLDGPGQGATRIDPAGTTVRIAVAADSERFHEELLATLNGGAPPPDNTATSPAEVEYFRAVEQSVRVLRDAIDTLLRSQLETEMQGIEQRAANDELTPEDDVTLRTFLTDFWTGAEVHTTVLRDALLRLDPPAAVQPEHDAYVAALDALIASTHDRLADIQTRDTADLLSSLWEPSEEIEAMTASCEALHAAASSRGITTMICP